MSGKGKGNSSYVAKRHSKAKPTGTRLTNGSIKQLSVVAGINRLSTDIRETVKTDYAKHMKDLTNRAAIFTQHARRRTITETDVVRAAKDMPGLSTYYSDSDPVTLPGNSVLTPHLKEHVRKQTEKKRAKKAKKKQQIVDGTGTEPDSPPSQEFGNPVNTGFPSAASTNQILPSPSISQVSVSSTKTLKKKRKKSASKNLTRKKQHKK